MEHQEHADEELDERLVAIRNRDAVLPARENARGAQDSSELDEAQQTQHLDEAEQRGGVELRCVDGHENEVDGDNRDEIQREPAAHVVARNESVRLDLPTTFLDRLGVRQEEVEANVNDEDAVDEDVEDKQRREPLGHAIFEHDLFPH